MTNTSSKIKLEDAVFVGFDTETTGLSPVAHRLVELSAVKFQLDGSVISTFSQLIDPECPIAPEATAVHGITDRMVQGMPTYREAIPAFLEWLKGENVVLVAHNASFDLGFLEVAFAKMHQPAPGYPVVDTLALSRLLVTDTPNHQLRTLVEHLGLESGGFHRALADSFHVKDLLARLLVMMPEWRTLADLAGACQILNFTDLRQEGFKQMEAMPPGFDSIRGAISAEQPISLVYNNGHSAERIVTPHSVHSWRGNLYLSGFCHTVQAERTFRLDKIVRFHLLEQ